MVKPFAQQFLLRGQSQVKKIWLFLKKHSRAVQWVFTWFLLLLIILYLFENQDRLRSLFKLDIRYVLALSILQGFTLLLHTARLYPIINKFSKRHIAYKNLVPIFILGRFINMFVSQGGNLYRAIALKSRYEFTYTYYIAAFLVYVWLDTIFSFSIALIIVWWANPNVTLWNVSLQYVLGLMILLVLLGPFMLDIVLLRVRPKGGITKSIHQKITLLIGAARSVARDFELMLKFSVFELITFGVMIVSFYIAFLAIGVETELYQLSVLYALEEVSLVIMITPGNLGVREFAFATVGQAIGIDITTGLLVSMIIRLTHSLVLILMGVALGGIQQARQLKRNQAESTGLAL